MKLYLVRHGDFEDIERRYGQIDGPLTDLGKKKAEKCANYFSDKDIVKIYSSDLRRTVGTAGIINLKLNLEINLRAELREIYRGDWETSDSNDQKYTEFKAEWEKHESDLPYPNGECGRDVLKRVSKLINSINIKSNNDKSVLFVTHGGVIRSLLAEFSDLDQAKRFNFHPEFCSITLIEIADNKKQIIKECAIKHLEA